MIEKTLETFRQNQQFAHDLNKISEALVMEENEVRIIQFADIGSALGIAAACIKGKRYLLACVEDSGWYPTEEGELGDDGEIVRESRGASDLTELFLDVERGVAVITEVTAEEDDILGVVYATAQYIDSQDSHYLNYIQDLVEESGVEDAKMTDEEARPYLRTIMAQMVTKDLSSISS